MTENSLICTYISEHPDSWEGDFERMGVRVKRGEHELVIFNYGIAADFSKPIVREARGIIVEEPSLSVVCWPFTKFGNSFESYADTDDMDWESAVVQEKLDGSIVKLYHHDDRWRWATNSCIDANEATIQGSAETFADIIEQAVNYADIDWSALDETCTYIFELVSPKTQIVIAYPHTKLYHIGTRSNVTGEERNPSDAPIGIDRPRVFGVGGTLDEWIREVERLNGSDGACTDEGYVIVDGYWHRIKVKSARYLQLHHALGNGVLRKEDALDIIMTHDEERRSLVFEHERLLCAYKFYDWRFAEFRRRVGVAIASARSLWESLGGDRKAFAMKVKGDDLSYFLFKAIDSDKSASELISDIGIKVVAKYVDDYQSPE